MSVLNQWPGSSCTRKQALHQQLGTKRGRRIQNLFHLSNEHIYLQVYRRSLNKEGKKTRTKTTKIQCPVIPQALQNCLCCISLKKQNTKKNKEETADCIKLSANRMKKAKSLELGGQRGHEHMEWEKQEQNILYKIL